MPARIFEKAWLMFGFALMLSPQSAEAAVGVADSYVTNSNKEDERVAWVVDSDLNNMLNAQFGDIELIFGSSIDLVLGDNDVVRLLDLSLQSMIGGSRAEMGARVIGVEQCDDDDADHTPCLVGHDASDQTKCPFGVAADARCDSGGCNIVICVENMTMNSLSILPQILSHEIGHIYGLNHVPDSPPSGPLSNTCDGELMCRGGTQRSNSSFPENGDSTGLRVNYGGSTVKERKVFFDRDVGALNQPNWTQSTLAGGARFQPRIACPTGSSPTNDCVMVVTSNLQDKVVKLDGVANGSETWITQATVATFPRVSDLAPDIAVNPEGTVAYVIRTNAARTTYVTRVPLDGSSTTTKTVFPANVEPVIPPRIAWANGQLQVVAWVHDDNDFAARPRWEFRNVNALATLVTNPPFSPAPGGEDLNDPAFTFRRRTMTEFDFDCRNPGPHEAHETCTIVAQVFRTDMDYELSAIHSFRFNTSSSSTFPYPQVVKALDADFEVLGGFASNRVSGVVLTDSHLYVAHGRLITGGADTSNYRIRKFVGTSVTGTLADNEKGNLDGSTCATTTSPHDNDAMPAATTHGGISIGFCKSCPNGGSINSVSWGRRVDNNDFCH